MENMENKSEETVGRNEPCPCGSGKKYKRCHGVGAAPKLTTPAVNPMATGAGGLPFDINSLDPQWMMQFSQALQRLPAGQMQKLQAIMQKAMAGKDVTREAADFERQLPPQFQHLLKSFKMPEGAGAAGAVPGMPNIEGIPGMEAFQGMSPEEIQKAMAEQFAGMDPEELQKQMASMGDMAGMMSGRGDIEAESAPLPQTEDDAKKIVAQALADGKISAEQAAALLGTDVDGANAAAAAAPSTESVEEGSRFSKLWKSMKK